MYHRSLNPKNILINIDLNLVKITDFGVIKFFDCTKIGSKI